jgi:hypothetical protein
VVPLPELDQTGIAERTELFLKALEVAEQGGLDQALRNLFPGFRS